MLSVRSFNICIVNGLNTVNEVLEYFSNNLGFTKFRNCGQKSNEELIEFCEKYSMGDIHNNIMGAKSRSLFSEYETRDLINKLTREDWDMFTINLSTSSKELSTRCQNIIRQVLGLNDRLKIINELLIIKYNPTNVKNVGPKTAQELFNFVEEKINLLNEISEANHEDKSPSSKDFRRFKLKLKSELNVEVSDLPITENDFMSKTLKIFSMLEKICFSKVFHENESEYHIFLYGTGFDKRFPIKILEEIGNDLDLTRERVRQIKIKLIDNVFHRFSFLSEFISYTSYSFFQDKLFIINREFVETINNDENTSLTRDFIGRVICHLIPNKSVLGIEFKYSGKLKNYGYTLGIIQDSGKLKNLYVLEKSIFEKMNLYQLLTDVGQKMKEKVEKDVHIEKVTYFQKFAIDLDEEKSEIISTILKEEFSHEVFRAKHSYVPLRVTNDTIIISRNTKWKAWEYVYKVLEDLGEPSHKREIKIKLKQMFPNIKVKSISGAVLSYPDIFISFGRTSTYGLKVWEQKGLYKGGTIRELVEEYLDNWEKPMHINDITKYVQRFRETTNSNSIFYNIKIMNPKKNPFLFFKGGLLGLKSKNYYNKDKLVTSTSPSSLEDLIDDFF